MNALNPTKPKPNVSRRPPSNILYAFPHFDRCDSLLYFPCTLTKYMNGADMVGLGKLLSAHLDKDCQVMMDYASRGVTNAKGLMRIYEVMMDLQPDRIMCVHSTKVVENQITASIYLKCTDVLAIHDSMARTVTDPVCYNLFHLSRADRLKGKVVSGNRTEEELEQMISYINSGQDLLVYVHVQMVLTFNDMKRVTKLDFTGELTSLHPVS